ncbi:MAG: hypothetical protein KKG00_03040 [Bacteroidetes bacterium]|nr:hypothetical protein [Bacteroidota bacterium]
MGDSAAFYQTFFQYDVLFRIPEKKDTTVEPKEAPPVESPVTVIQEPVPPQVAPAPVPTPPPAVTPEVKAAPFPSLRHRILVLVDETRQPELAPEDALLLDKILKATGHSAAETDLINFSYIPQADARTVLATKSTNYFITFGVPLIKLQLDLLLPPYTPKQIEGIWFLLADPLPTINADKALKKRLWLALQKMFAIA